MSQEREIIVQDVIKKFAQKLACNDKKIRDKALKALRRWFETQSKTEPGLSHTEMMQIWKGLHYDFWMSDKPIVQEDLATSMSNIINMLSSKKLAYLYVTTFFETISREWILLDHLRLDKFLMLFRRMLSASFTFIKNSKYDSLYISKFSKLVYDFMIGTEDQWCAPNGLKYHFVDIYFSELARVCLENEKEDEVIQIDQLMSFLDPFCQLVAYSKNKDLVDIIIKSIFDEILKALSIARNRIKTDDDENVDDGDANVGDVDDGDVDDGDITDDKSNSDEEPMETGEDLEDNDDDEEEEEIHYDQEDEGVSDALICQFPWDASELHTRLFQISKDKKCSNKSRDKLYNIVKRLHQLEAGTYVDMSLKNKEHYLQEAALESSEPDYQIKSSASELIAFEEKLEKSTTKAFKRKQKELKIANANKIANGESISDDDVEDVENSEEELPDSNKKEFDTVEQLEHLAKKIESGLTKRKRKRKRKINKTIATNGENTELTNGEKYFNGDNDDNEPENIQQKKKRKLQDADSDISNRSPKKKKLQITEDKIGEDLMTNTLTMKSPVKKNTKTTENCEVSPKKSSLLKKITKSVENSKEESPKKSPVKKITKNMVNSKKESPKKSPVKKVTNSEESVDLQEKKSPLKNNLSTPVPKEDSTHLNVDPISLFHGKDSLELKHEATNNDKKLKKKKKRKSLPTTQIEKDEINDVIAATFLSNSLKKVNSNFNKKLSTPKSIKVDATLATPGSKKKVEFQLNKNTQQVFIKNQSMSSMSPITPYNPDSQPSCGILKEMKGVLPMKLFKNKNKKKKNKNKISL